MSELDSVHTQTYRAQEPVESQDQVEDSLKEVYQPSMQLFDDDYKPYFDMADNIKIEELEVEAPARPSGAKEFQSNTTRAEITSPLTGKDRGQPLDAHNFLSAMTGGASEYFSSKFGEGAQPPFAPEESSKDLAGQHPKEEGAISKKLKEFIKQHKAETLDKEAKRSPGEDGHAKKWSSLSGRDDGSRSANPRKGEGADPAGHHSEKVNTSSQLLAEDFSQTDDAVSDSVMVAKYDFVGEKSRDLNFKRGDIIRLIDRKPNGWWLAEVDGRIGFVPSNYLISKKEFQGSN